MCNDPAVLGLGVCSVNIYIYNSIVNEFAQQIQGATFKYSNDIYIIKGVNPAGSTQMYYIARGSQENRGKTVKHRKVGVKRK